jgi:hypothetical protein
MAVDDDKHTLKTWFGLSEPFDWRKRSYLGPLLFVVGILVVGGLFTLAIAAAFNLLGSAVFGGLPQGAGSSFGLTGIIVAMIGAPFVVWRAVVAQKQVNVAEQGMITDRISKAVEGLGIEKEVSWVGRSVTVWSGVPSDRQQTYQTEDDIKLPPRSMETSRGKGIEHYYRAPLKIAHGFALRYRKAMNWQWGCNDGADGFLRSFGPLRELGRQEGPAGRDRCGRAVGGVSLGS